MVGTLRFYVRFPLLLACTFFYWGVWTVTYVALGGTNPRSRRARRGVVHAWGRSMLWLFGARVVREGTPPPAPAFLVSNHLSYLDIFLLARETGCAFVARANMERWPVAGRIIRCSHNIFINRDQARDTARVVPLIDAAISQGDAVHVFAESTCSRGAEVRAFKPALFEMAAEKGFPVHCVALSYKTPEGCPPAGDDVAWWRKEPMLAHLRRMLRLPHVTATIRFAETPVTGTDRKALAEAAHAVVSGMFVPLEQGALEEADEGTGRDAL